MAVLGLNAKTYLAGTIASPVVSFVEHGNLCTHMLLGERVAQFQMRICGSFGCHDAQTCDVASGSFSYVEVGGWRICGWSEREVDICQEMSRCRARVGRGGAW